MKPYPGQDFPAFLAYKGTKNNREFQIYLLLFSLNIVNTFDRKFVKKNEP